MEQEILSFKISFGSNHTALQPSGLPEHSLTLLLSFADASSHCKTRPLGCARPGAHILDLLNICRLSRGCKPLIGELAKPIRKLRARYKAKPDDDRLEAPLQIRERTNCEVILWMADSSSFTFYQGVIAMTVIVFGKQQMIK